NLVEALSELVKVATSHINSPDHLVEALSELVKVATSHINSPDHLVEALCELYLRIDQCVKSAVSMDLRSLYCIEPTVSGAGKLHKFPKRLLKPGLTRFMVPQDLLVQRGGLFENSVRASQFLDIGCKLRLILGYCL